MDNWEIKFNFHEKGIDCDVDLSGSAFAVSHGAQIAIASVRDKFTDLIMSGNGSKELIDEFALVGEIVKGEVKPFTGKYLNVKRLKTKAKGLMTTIELKWTD